MNTRSKILFLTLVVLFLLPSFGLAWSGKCVGVSDGDTISVMHEGKAERIRLYGIDCPERRQPYSKKAKKFTSKLVYKEFVEVKPVTQD